MKIKYDKKLIFDYINGNDIENYNIDSLENDYLFMGEVIKITKDKRMYELCGEDVKNNCSFVKILIELFKDDLNFVSKVADIFLKNATENEKLEITILLSLLDKENTNDKFAEYKVKAELYYQQIELNIENILSTEEDQQLKNQLGIGFYFIIDHFGLNKNVANFFAAKFIRQIFFNNSYTLEERIHKEFKDFKKIEEKGINSFLLDRIRHYDNYLADYVTTNLYLLDELKQKLNRIMKNWDNYISIINRRRVEIVRQEVSKYYDENEMQINFNCYDIVDQIISSLNLEKVFQIDTVKTNDKLSFEEYKFKNQMLKFIKKLFSSDLIDKTSEDSNVEDRKDKAKVITIDFSKK